MKKVLFAGSFHPPTLGHYNIISRAASLCDQLYVGVAINKEKSVEMFSVEERVAKLKEMVQGCPNIVVVTIEALVSDFVLKEKIDFLVRGVRNGSDLGKEMELAYANKKLCGIETLFLPADGEYRDCSSTIVREIASFGGDITPFTTI